MTRSKAKDISDIVNRALDQRPSSPHRDAIEQGSMSRVPVIEVSVTPMDPETGLAPGTLKSIAEADAYILAHPQIRFEFRVQWQDGTAQVGRVTGKTVSAWIRDWLEMALGDLSTLSASALKARTQLQRDPKLVAHAKLLQESLQIT